MPMYWSCGGAEAAICPIGIAGFVACRAMSTHFNDEPHRASRPYDADRDGFVMGEGAGVLVLEELEHARARGAKIYAEVLGYGLAGDAFHITAPADDGDGGFRAMRAAIAHAGIEPADIDYINAHGTSTPLGDEIELRAVERLAGNAAARITMSSTKSSIGHLLGAAEAVEAAFSILAIRDQIAPPTLNLDNPSVETALNLVASSSPAARNQRCPFQQFRVRRHQRQRYFQDRPVTRRPRAAAGAARHVARRKRPRGGLALGAVGFVVAAIPAVGAVLVFGPGPEAKAGPATNVVLAPGSRLPTIASTLGHAGVVRFPILFLTVAELSRRSQAQGWRVQFPFARLDCRGSGRHPGRKGRTPLCHHP